MRVDVVSIFPDYLAPLDLSLIGKARRDGILDVRVHDLRDFTHDRHRTVDDSPFGGGAGMVMKPEPWAEALDHVVASGAERGGAVPHLVVPGPGGRAVHPGAGARRWPHEPWLAFACGRYEGIDERVYEHAARPDAGRRWSRSATTSSTAARSPCWRWSRRSARLLPGVVGNAESLVEESHEDGLLEYPVYTKPPEWRRDVREVPAGAAVRRPRGDRAAGAGTSGCGARPSGART